MAGDIDRILFTLHSGIDWNVPGIDCNLVGLAVRVNVGVTTVCRGVDAKLGDEAGASCRAASASRAAKGPCFAEGRAAEPPKTFRAIGEAGRVKGKDTEPK